MLRRQRATLAGRGLAAEKDAGRQQIDIAGLARTR